MNASTGPGPSHAAVVLFEGRPGAFRHGVCDLPEPAEGERLVRVLATTICGSDLHTWEGRRHSDVPTVLGHEIVGEVVASGPGCADHDVRGRSLAVGSRVTWGIVASCGTCPRCTEGWPQKCRRGIKYGHARAEGRRTLTGGLSTHCLLAPGTTVLAIDDALPLAVACPASCATATVARAVAACGGLRGAVVGVTGCGMLGLTACAMATAAGARVIAVEPDPGRRSLATRFGATAALQPAAFSDGVAQAAPDGLDAVIEVSGSNTAFSDAVDGLRIGGTMILVGAVAPAPDVPVSLESIVRRCLTIRGIHNYGPSDLVAAVDFLERHGHEFPFAHLVSAWFPLDEAEAAFAAAADPDRVRVGIVPDRRMPRPSQGLHQPVEAGSRSALRCVASSSESPFKPQAGHEDSLTRPGSEFGEGVNQRLER